MDIAQFTTVLTKSRLLTDSDVEQLSEAFQLECQRTGINATVDGFCTFLVSSDRLTRWQCEKLRVGKWKGFYLDNYVLLEQSGKGPDFASYKSRDIRDGKVVNLVVKPVNQTGGRIEYRVEPFEV